MLGNIYNKNILVRFVCMIMLVLIQFDVYGYDLIYASQQPDIDVSVFTCNDETLVSQASEVDSEWTDPFYKNTPQRYSSDIIYCIVSELFSFLPLANYRDILKITESENILLYEQESYLRFRVLLI